MKNLIIILIFKLLFFHFALAQSFQWAVTTNPKTTQGKALIKNDRNGNLFVITQYACPTIGHYQYIKYALLAKYNTSGGLISQDTLKNFYVYDFCVSTDNSIYLTGYINEDSAYIANLTLTEAGAPFGRTFIIRYISNTIANIIDDSKNASGICYNGTAVGICSGINNSMYFYGSRNLPNNGRKLFLAKYNPSIGFIFNSQILNASADQFLPGMAQDSSGNLYMIGILTGSAQFGTTILGGGSFLAKADSSCNFITAASISGGIQYQSYSADASGNVYITGFPSAYSASTILKYDNSGTFIWSKTFLNSLAAGIYTDQRGNVYLTGQVTSRDGTPQFDSYVINGYGMYLTKINPTDGNVIWLQSITVPNDIDFRANGSAVYSDGNGNLYAAGGISTTTQFGSTILNSVSGFPGPTGYLTKVIDNNLVNGIRETENNSTLNIYPNPTAGIFQINYTSTEKNNLQLKITNSIGKIIYDESIYNFNGEFKKELDLSKQAKGTYFIEIINNKKKQVKKIVLD